MSGKIWEKKQFVEEVQKGIARKLGEDYEVTTQVIRKNNNVQRQALVATQQGKNLSPTVYLDGFYEEYRRGKDLDVVLEEILRLIREDAPKEDVDEDFFRDYDTVREKLCYRLINAEKNRELLEEIPHIPFLDLAISFFYPFDGYGIWDGSIQIRNSHLERWGVSVKELWKDAEKNTQKRFPPQCRSMATVLGALRGTGEEAQEGEGRSASTGMSVLSNRQRVYGSSALLYDQYLAQLGERFGTNFYILPCSVHEVILMPETGSENPYHLKHMILDVNETQVEEQDMLSNNLYYYDREKKTIRIIA